MDEGHTVEVIEAASLKTLWSGVMFSVFVFCILLMLMLGWADPRPVGGGGGLTSTLMQHGGALI